MSRKALFGGMVLLLIVLGTGAYVIAHKNPNAIVPSESNVISAGNSSSSTSPTDQQQQNTPGAISINTPAPVVVDANSNKYTNTKYHFSLLYPNNLKVTESTEDGGAMTVTFENADNSQGMDIFIVPYTGKTVSKAQFLSDEPSGVHAAPVQITIDGKGAEMFFGNNPIMGDTREVWFIQGGYLYEVATYKSLDSWLSNIMKTWKFI